GYAYPFSKLSGTTKTLASNRTLAYQNFLALRQALPRRGSRRRSVFISRGLFVTPCAMPGVLRQGITLSPQVQE
ncbi:MAG: hypothetical protein V2A69_05865, partial [Pseudomonadota bacterium]